VCGGGGEVVGVDGEDVGGVPVGVVVGQGCCVASGGGAQVVVVGAEVAGGGCGGLVDVLDVAAAPSLPGRGDELQGPGGSQGCSGGVGEVADDPGVGSVQCWADERGASDAVLVEGGPLQQQRFGRRSGR